MSSRRGEKHGIQKGGCGVKFCKGELCAGKKGRSHSDNSTPFGVQSSFSFLDQVRRETSDNIQLSLNEFGEIETRSNDFALTEENQITENTTPEHNHQSSFVSTKEINKAKSINLRETRVNNPNDLELVLEHTEDINNIKYAFENVDPAHFDAIFKNPIVPDNMILDEYKKRINFSGKNSKEYSPEERFAFLTTDEMYSDRPKLMADIFECGNSIDQLFIAKNMCGKYDGSDGMYKAEYEKDWENVKSRLLKHKTDDQTRLYLGKAFDEPRIVKESAQSILNKATFKEKETSVHRDLYKEIIDLKQPELNLRLAMKLKDPETLNYLAKNSKKTDKFCNIIATRKDLPSNIKAVIASSTTSSEALTTLAKNEKQDHNTIMAIITNKNTPLEVLEYYRTDAKLKTKYATPAFQAQMVREDFKKF